jgi:hypothetical protein
MKIHPEDIKIIVKINNKNKLLATADVIFYDFLETKGWRISSTELIDKVLQEKLWIQRPSYFLYGKYYANLFINDEESYNYIKLAIYDEYKKKAQGLPPQPSPENETSEEVDINDIPF